MICNDVHILCVQLDGFRNKYTIISKLLAQPQNKHTNLQWKFPPDLRVYFICMCVRKTETERWGDRDRE